MTPGTAGTPCALLECSRHATRSPAPERHESEKQGSPSREAERNQQNGQINRKQKSTRLNSSHVAISYAVFCLKKKKKKKKIIHNKNKTIKQIYKIYSIYHN